MVKSAALRSLRRESLGDRVFLVVNGFFLCLAGVLVLYPLIVVVSSSFSDPMAVVRGDVLLFPVRPTLQAYQMVLKDGDVLTGYRNTLFYTTAGTLLNIAMTICAAFPLSRRDLYGRNLFTILFSFTMFFSGGLIPTYILVRSLGLINTFWAMILPGAVSMWNIVLLRTYFQSSVPFELQEAAFLDGSSNIRILVSIILPLSKPILAVLVLFYGVGHWNAFFNALIYLSQRTRYPLQLVLREILISNQMADAMMEDMDSLATKQLLAEGIKYALIIVSSLPVLVLYPFLQRYFVKGVLIGSLKG